MRAYWGAFLLATLAACSGCAGRQGPQAPEGPPVSAIALIGRYGAAHACAVEGYVITAAHVAEDVQIVEGRFVKTQIPYVAEDPATGQVGLATLRQSNDYVDLAILDLTIEPLYFKKGEVAVGDRVRWIEYDFHLVKGAYAPVVRDAQVVNLRALQIIMDRAPERCASGPCLFNADGDVVGIISGFHPMEDGAAGVAVVIKLPKGEEGH